MENKEKLHADLVQECVKFLFSKFETLSEEERKYIAPASVEATAWFAAAGNSGDTILNSPPSVVMPDLIWGPC